MKCRKEFLRKGWGIFLLVLILSCVGCSSGGSNDSTQGPPVISTSMAVPGQLITVEDGSIQEDEIVDVEFRQKATGSDTTTSVTVKGIAASDGSVDVAVPPVIDPSNGTFSSGSAIVAIEGRAAENELMIENYPAFDSDTNGLVTAALLEMAVDEYNKTMSNLSDVEADVPTFTSELGSVRLEVQKEIDTLEAWIDEIESKGTLTIDEDTTLATDDLNQLDIMQFQTIAALNVLNDTDDELEDLTGNGDGSEGDDEDITLIDITNGATLYRADFVPDFIKRIKSYWKKGIAELNKFKTPVKTKEAIKGIFQAPAEQMKKDAQKGVPLLLGELSLLFSTASQVKNLKHAANAAGIKHAQVSALVSLIQAILTQENTDAMNSGDNGKFSGTGEVISNLSRLASQYLSAEEGQLGNLGTLINVSQTIKDMTPSIKEILCKNFGRFCDESSGSDSSGNATSSGISYVHYINFDGSEGSSAQSADIEISGSTSKLTIRWPGKATALFVTAITNTTGSESIPYALISQSDGTVPFKSPVVYGDYSISGTNAAGTKPSPALSKGMVYTIQVVNTNNEQAILTFSFDK